MSIFEIDEHDLVGEWKKQVQLYQKYVDKAAERREELESAKANVNLVYAEVELAIRDNPSLYDLGKATDKAIASAVLVQREYKMALKRLSEARYAMDIVDGRIKVLDNRKKALENLVQLFLANYYSEPRVSGGDSTKFDDVRKNRAFRPIKQDDDDDDG